MSLLIKDGTVITASDIYNGDIYIEDSIIKKIGINLKIKADEVIDAKGKYVIPGGVDIHTHLNLDPSISVGNDDFYTGTVSAAFGGTTTVVDHMGFGPKGCNLQHQVNAYHNYADDKCAIDYSFHGVIQHVDDDIINEIKKIIEQEGITSFKLYLTYDYMINDEGVIKVLNRLKELKGIMAVHCENDGSIKFLKEVYKKRGLTNPLYHYLSRPVECEGEAINRMISIASIVKNAPLYIVHLSTELGLEYIRRAKDNGQKVYVETCPHYLLLDESKYKTSENEALKYIISPPLRSKKDIEKLWEGINEGYIQTIGSDHCPFSFKEDKEKYKENFIKCPNGNPGVEERIPIMFSEGVMKGRISLNKFVDLCCTKPAKIFGLYPKKGTIQVGSDGDITIIDPQKEVIISKNNLHSNVDYSSFEGIKIKGYPIFTILRGKIIVKENKFVGEKGYGKFIKRSKVNLNNI